MSERCEARFSVRVKPGARKNALVSFDSESIVVRVAAPPVEGKANAELVSFLSGILGVPKSSVSIIRGHAARTKHVGVEGLSLEVVLARLRKGMKEPQTGTLDGL